MSALPILDIIFCVFAVLLLATSLLVVLQRNPIRAVLFLILSFFCASVLWLCMQAEFLGLVLVFVYVGAVMTLFVFVTMMLNIDTSALKGHLSKLLPLAIVLLGVFVGIAYLTIKQSDWHHSAGIQRPAHYSDVKAVGVVLFNEHYYEFEVAAAILLVAIMGAITLTLRSRRSITQSQSKLNQLAATKAGRLRIVKDMKEDSA